MLFQFEGQKIKQKPWAVYLVIPGDTELMIASSKWYVFHRTKAILLHLTFTNSVPRKADQRQMFMTKQDIRLRCFVLNTLAPQPQ